MISNPRQKGYQHARSINTKSTAAQLILLLMTLLLACAPASPPMQGGETEPPVQPTSKPPDVKPTPTRDPGDPAVPTPLPTPTWSPPEKPTSTPKDESRQVGYTFDYCAGLSLFDPSPDIGRDVIHQCSQTIGKTVQERCTTGNGVANEEEQACSKRLPEQVKDYQLRRLAGYECLAVGWSTDEELLQCLADEGEHHQRLQSMLQTTTIETLAVVDRDPDVNQAEKRAWACLEASGDKNLAAQDVNLNRLLFWQEWVTDEQHVAVGSLPQPRLGKIYERIAIIDRCAAEAGVYEARLEATLEELHRLVAEEPAKAEPWVELGLLAALQKFGTTMLRPQTTPAP